MNKRTVLVVDDDHDMVATLCDILELHGWSSFRAYDGIQAIAVSNAHDLDVVVMDIRMPHMNGVEALRLIRHRHPSVPIILVTAMAAQELLNQAEREGAVRILKKPLDVPNLLQVLDHAVAA